MSPPNQLDVTSPEDSSEPPTASSRARSRRSSRIGLLAVLAVPVLNNLAAILGLVKYAPEATQSGIGFITKVGYLASGNAFIDPNVGYNSQSLGHAAALAWLHGHIPWWNLNEGLGMPLAGSIQSASFFPLVLFQGLPQGSLWFHIAVECAIGWATYALLRELRCSPFAAAVGAIAFELNGAIAWITNAPINPVAFLPMALLGVEYVMKASGAKRRGGWVLLALAVWLSFVSGFPEVAVINSGLVAGWFVIRLIQQRRDARGIVVRTGTGVVVGLLLAAPVLNAFLRYLRVANVGLHTLQLSSLTVPKVGAAQLVTPYLYGGIFAMPRAADPNVFVVWSRIGGYAGATLLLLATAALFGSRERWIRFLLGAWALLFLGSAFGVPGIHQIVENIPGLTHLAVFRYATASSLLCLSVLAALFIDDVPSLRPSRLAPRLAAGMALVVGIFAIGFFAEPGGRTWSHLHLPRWYWGSIGILALVLAVTALGMLLALSRWRRAVPIILGVMLALEASAYFVVPILTFPRAVHYDTQVVDFLHSSLGTQRFYTVEPVSPNYGTYYNVASLDAADLPIPKNWANYVHTQLNPYVLPWQFGNGGPGTGQPSPLVAMLTNMPAYEQAAVKFLVAPSGTHLYKYFQPRTGLGPATVDGGAVIVMSWRPPTYLVTGVLTGFSVPLPRGLPAGTVVTACSGGACRSATPVAPLSAGQGASTQSFLLSAPLRLGATFRIRLASSFADPINILTVPSVPDSPAAVTSNGVSIGTALQPRSAVATFVYDPTSLPRLVKQTESSNVYELPNPSPIATAPGCIVVAHTMTSFTTTCRSASLLTYRELSFPGWKATVNGAGTSISTVNGVFQQIEVPSGSATIAFSYSPAGSIWAWIAALVGIIVIAVNLLLRRGNSGSRRTSVTGAPSTPDPAAPEGDAAAAAALASDQSSSGGDVIAPTTTPADASAEPVGPASDAISGAPEPAVAPTPPEAPAGPEPAGAAEPAAPGEAAKPVFAPKHAAPDPAPEAALEETPGAAEPAGDADGPAVT